MSVTQQKTPIEQFQGFQVSMFQMKELVMIWCWEEKEKKLEVIQNNLHVICIDVQVCIPANATRSKNQKYNQGKVSR